MAVKALDGDGASVYLETAGAGTLGSPFVGGKRLVGVQKAFPASLQLTAPGSTSPVDCSGYGKIGCYYQVSSIDTDVDINFEISPDNTNWFRVGANINQTADGFYLLSAPITIPAQSVRGVFVAENGGTNAVIDFYFVLGF